MSGITPGYLRELAQEAREDYEPEDLAVTFDRAADLIEQQQKVIDAAKKITSCRILIDNATFTVVPEWQELVDAIKNLEPQQEDRE